METPVDARIPVNMEMIKSVTRGNPEKIHQLITLYLKQNTQHVQALGQALAQSNTEEVRQIAHAMTGSGSFLGATQLTIPLIELEQMGKSGRLVPKSHDLMAQVEKEFARIQTFFSRFSYGH